jgi:hypothetical protein
MIRGSRAGISKTTIMFWQSLDRKRERERVEAETVLQSGASVMTGEVELL